MSNLRERRRIETARGIRLATLELAQNQGFGAVTEGAIAFGIECDFGFHFDLSKLIENCGKRFYGRHAYDKGCHKHHNCERYIL